MKEGWTYKKLEDVIDNLRTGLNPRTHFKLNTEDALGYYITVRELKGFHFETNDKTDRINEIAIKRINERSNLKIGDVLYSGTGTIGKTALVSELPTWWNIKEGVYAITPLKDVLNSYYLIYLMHSGFFRKKVLSRTSGTTVRSIPMKELKGIIIPIPPISEQQQIVSYLDNAFAQIDQLKENAEKQLQDAKALFQKTLDEMMKPKEGWENKKFGDVGTFQRGGGFIKRDYVEDGFPCIHYGQIHMYFGTSTDKHLYCIPHELVSKSRIATKGDIIIAITSEDVEGSCKSTAWLGNYDVAVGGHTAIYRHKLNPLFVSYYIQSSYFQKEKKLYTHGFKVVEIKPSDIAKIDISFPNKEEQEKIVKQLNLISNRIKELEIKQNTIISQVDIFKQAVLRQVFE